MKLLDLRKQLKSDFKALGIEETDADFIVAEVLKVPKTELVFIDTINQTKAKQILKYANKRKHHIPVDKLFKKDFFYGLEFYVNKNVLSPRQDSELVVDTALKYIYKQKYKSVLDLCTGSGCLATAIKKNAEVLVTASDVSLRALRVAKHNAKQNEVEIKFVKSNMFNNIKTKFDLIVSNPPYIATADLKFLDEEVVKCDPTLALDGGKDGLNFYRVIKNRAKEFLNPNGMLVLEIGNEQKEDVISLFADYKLVETLKDYGGNDRVVVLKI